jgi:pimeloyl-ACP methyl ester carboxylesterase
MDQPKPTFVLIHGSFHGSWCWKKIVALLQREGYAVVAPDLHASGADSNRTKTASLNSYTARMSAVIDSISGPVILVAHSMGGVVTAQVTEMRHERLVAAIYVNGLLLRTGESLLSFLEQHRNLDVDDLVLKNMQVSPDGQLAIFPADKATEVFYNTCDPADAEWAKVQLTPQPTQVYADTLRLTSDRFERVKRFYVRGTADQAVSVKYQDIMLHNTHCTRVFTLHGDHSPFLSAPAQLKDILVSIARNTA